ncbi:MAG TPA: hypothetical protein VFZ34_15435 [Blastocatellia bacterium]|nr:hypothetical protein [Blastocatellia bacterium]
MLTDEQGVKLHHRSVLGETLPAEEQAALEAWYAKQDEEEMKSFQFEADEPEIAQLEQRFKESLNQLVEETHHLQQLEQENELLQQEVTRLQQRLARKQMLEAA